MQCLKDMRFVTNFNSVYGDGKMDSRNNLKKKKKKKTSNVDCQLISG